MVMYLLVLGLNVGTHVQKLVHDAEIAVPGRKVKRIAAILQWWSRGSARKDQWQMWSLDQVKLA
jgi:hypothetical protein